MARFSGAAGSFSTQMNEAEFSERGYEAGAPRHGSVRGRYHESNFVRKFKAKHLVRAKTTSSGGIKC